MAEPLKSQSKEAKLKSSKLDGLQHLRALAAALVLIEHAQIQAAEQFPNFFQPVEFPWGSGVDIFFVISGFVMVHSTRNDIGGPQDALIFMARRITRIAPLYYFYTILMILAVTVVGVGGGAISISDTISSFLFWPSLNFEGQYRPILQLGWTLNYEMAFYAIFSIWIWLGRKHLVGGATLTIILMVLIGEIASPSGAAQFWTRPIVLEFVGGMLIAHNLNNPRPVSFSRANTLVFSAVMAFAYYQIDSYIRPLTSGLVGCALVYVAVHNPVRISSSAAERMFSVLGDSSYSLYLSHPFALALCALAWPKSLDTPWAFVFVACAIALAVSIASYFVLERPLIAASARLHRRSAQ